MTVPFSDLDAAYRELQPQLDSACQRVLASGQYLFGPELQAFETEFASYCCVRHCVAVANGLDALHLLLRASGIGPGHEVIVPGHTFIATWLAVSHAGATPVAVDVDASTCTLDPEQLEAAITPATRAILPVHLYGQPADMDAITAVARRHGLAVFEDAAQAHGARYRGRRVGGLGHGAGFSFYPAKNLGCFGDGGAVTTDDAALAHRVRLLRNYGSQVKYVHDAVGVNSRLSDLQAAFLRVKLRCLDPWNDRRTRLALAYRRLLAGVPGLLLPETPAWSEPVWHLFVVRSQFRDQLKHHLSRCGIASQIHYPIPPHLSGAYCERSCRVRPLPVTEALAREVLSLPMGPHLPDPAVQAVADALRAFAPDRRLAA
jgi:dTDP-3-amino-3,4,6-trideoxy-alpha-D-glucose transaminase